MPSGQGRLFIPVPEIRPGSEYTVNLGRKRCAKCAYCGMTVNLNRPELSALHVCGRRADHAN